LKIPQLLDDVALLKACNLGEHGYDAVAILTMTGHTHGSNYGLGILCQRVTRQPSPEGERDGESDSSLETLYLVTNRSIVQFQLLGQS
jgi:hypothetical protein